MAQFLMDLSSLNDSPLSRPAALAAWRACSDRLAELAASDHDDGSMLSAATVMLRDTLHAAYMAVFRVAETSQGDEATDGLVQEAFLSEDSAMSRQVERRARAAARGAIRHCGSAVVYRTRAAAALPATCLVALASGSPAAPTAFVGVVPEDAVEDAATALSVLRPVLGALAQSARLRRELERSGRRQSQLQAIFTHSSEAVLTVDRDFTILEGNPALLSLLEWSDDSPVGRHCSQVLKCHDERGQMLCGTRECPLAQAFVLTNSAPYREVTWRTKSGKSKEISASFAAVPSPEDVRGVIIARDMTPVNAANRMRSNFISMVSHELRNPLNSINGFLEIVLEGHVGTLTTRQEEFLEYARMSTHQLMTLVEDILFISRADTGLFKLRIAAVTLAELTARLMMQFHPVAERAQVDLTFAIPDDLPTMHMDQLRIQQVIANLLNNAIKFTPPGGTVDVRASVASDAVLVEVRDTGSGIPIEDHERIFERFYQSGASSPTQAGGYGLGLAIARLIVQQHGGRIWVVSSPGQGSTFSFTIPIRADAADPLGSLDYPVAGCECATKRARSAPDS
jgi:two-component system phosphate regulon sensor histidine kinase PhoR